MELHQKTVVRKSKFSPEEDTQLMNLVRVHGAEDWMTIAYFMAGRNSRQYRERWRYSLSPSVLQTPFPPDEDARLLQKFAELGQNWKSITVSFEGRTDINVMSRWVLLTRDQRRTEEGQCSSRRFHWRWFGRRLHRRNHCRMKFLGRTMRPARVDPQNRLG
jgi:hypothetical protein